MGTRLSACRGCFLGLAVGDAMGFAVDEKSWDEIREDYGPNGLLGYDLVNGCAEGSSYTQVAAYVANGLLLGITRGKPENYLRYITLSLKEWARAQHFPRDPERSYCWVAKMPLMRRKKYKDSRMLDALRAATPGTPEAPINRAATPGSLTAAAMVGLAYNPKYMQLQQVVRLGAHTVALTHGDPMAFLSGAVVAECIAGILQDPQKSLRQHFEDAIAVMQNLYGMIYPQAEILARQLRYAMEQSEAEDPRQQMEKLGCDSAGQCLAGAMLACLACGEDFDTAMILAVNHSGRSAAVGALTGAFLGARLGAEALPDFYLESLEAASILEQLAEDMALGSPTMGLFDDDWDHKYTQGLPIGM